MTPCEIPFVIPRMFKENEDTEWIIEMYSHLIYNRYLGEEE